MVPKLAAIILTIGVIACVLLTTRQHRLQAVHELAQVQKRVAEHDRSLWKLRVEIARRSTPAAIERLAQQRGDLRPIVATPGGPPGPAAGHSLAQRDDPPPMRDREVH